MLRSLAVVAVLTASAAADVIHVPEEQPTLQAAVLVAFNGDEIVVADGLYTGPANRNVDFLGKTMIVRSENGPENCIIDADYAPQYVFSLGNGETPATRIEGFTIKRGPGVGGNGSAAIYCGASPTVIDCVFIECHPPAINIGPGSATRSAPRASVSTRLSTVLNRVKACPSR